MRGLACGGVWLWADKKSYMDRELCVLITMSIMGYITICLYGKCSCI